MRRLFSTQEAFSAGLTMAQLKYGEKRRKWRRIRRGIYGEGPAEPSPLDKLLAELKAKHAVASGTVAAVLHGLDGVYLQGPAARRRSLPADRIASVDGVPCADGVQTMIDLAATLDDSRWEQALESAVRKRLVDVADLEAALPDLGLSRTPGASRIRRVLALRPPGAPPTESLLETMFLQLARRVPGLPEPVRQYVVEDASGDFVARVDFAWPLLGLFAELDGQHHKGQPVYDARRETAVVAATGWLCARFTWTEVVFYPVATRRRLRDLVEQARRRPPAS